MKTSKILSINLIFKYYMYGKYKLIIEKICVFYWIFFDTENSYNFKKYIFYSRKIKFRNDNCSTIKT